MQKLHPDFNEKTTRDMERAYQRFQSLDANNQREELQRLARFNEERKREEQERERTRAGRVGTFADARVQHYIKSAEFALIKTPPSQAFIEELTERYRKDAWPRFESKDRADDRERGNRYLRGFRDRMRGALENTQKQYLPKEQVDDFVKQMRSMHQRILVQQLTHDRPLAL